MSILTKNGLISVKPFAQVPALLDLPAIKRGPASVSDVSGQGITAEVEFNPSEGCLVTKAIKYTHQLVQWVNASLNDRDDVIEYFIDDLGIIPYNDFSLNHPCNIAYLEAYLHTSLDLYAFIAITASSSTLAELEVMLKSNNDHRQQELDETGNRPSRILNFKLYCFVNPEYELVALHPEHLLPNNAVLTIYGPGEEQKNYVAAEDRCLRETQNSHSRYFSMIKQDPPSTPLPRDVLDLMHQTINFVRLLYWQPTLTRGSKGEGIFLHRQAWRQRSGVGSDEMVDGEGTEGPTPFEFREELRWLRNADMEERREYLSSLMGGHDCDYDPSLFGDAVPLNETHYYSELAAVELWKQGVSVDGLGSEPKV